MKIAFVGKGGAGKSTLCALFSDYLRKNIEKNIWVVDADMNIHISDLLNINHVLSEKYLSQVQSQKQIKEFLRCNNKRIKSINHIKKTTPPTCDSGFLDLSVNDNLVYKNFSVNEENLYLSVVGAYEKEGVGKSCYHNNLAILELALSHTIDINEFVVVDMVAGIDAFAGTLHAQFDVLVLSIEPTERSINVYKQYMDLAESAGVADKLFVIGNKIDDEDDLEFINSNINSNKLIGYIYLDKHLKLVDKKREILNYQKINSESIKTLNKLYEILSKIKISFNKRFDKLCELHKNYVVQEYIVDRFGDLTNQIDVDFDFDQFVIEKYGKSGEK